MVDIAQLVSVPGCGPGGRGFESHYSPHNENTLVWVVYTVWVRRSLVGFERAEKQTILWIVCLPRRDSADLQTAVRAYVKMCACAVRIDSIGQTERIPLFTPQWKHTRLSCLYGLSSTPARRIRTGDIEANAKILPHPKKCSRFCCKKIFEVIL